ncbi:MAG: 2Fe-2S iron-sulfur cluster-binding protein [Bacteroidota bacterium]|nr:2Fe-2S iron-sulfur cluster-binding protein [Bacteroidota bacterium]
MVKITIDGKQYEVENNLTIIQAARESKIHIPHFCWHPKLTVSGNCRVCLVEVEKMPKLVIACSTQVADGMIVHTNSEKVIKAQNAVLEFILINHPLDCPICDEAGECKLQDYAYKYSVGESRFEFDKVRKPKRVELGPNVMLDTERCIMCSRCIRFCDEIAKKPQLTFTQRGDHVELTTFPGECLDNPYSMNVIDLCPVGALTSRDFRFKARVWEMSSTDTICVGCSRGCNIKMWVRNNEILRLTPRMNPQVNDYWMCDYGRLNTFKHVNAANRIKAPMIRKEGKLVEVGWDEAIAKVSSELKAYKKPEIAAIGSAFSSNEDNYLFVKLMGILGVKKLDIMPHIKTGDQDELLIREDKTPNMVGTREVGVKPDSNEFGFSSIMNDIRHGKVRALYVLDDDIAADPNIAEALIKIDFLVVHASNENETVKLADVVLASSSYAEKHGTFTNFQGKVQRNRPAVATLDHDRILDGMELSRLDKFGSHNDRWTQGIKRDTRATWRIVNMLATAIGIRWRYNTCEEVFNEIAAAIPAFKGLSYLKIGTNGALLNLKKKSVTVKD